MAGRKATSKGRPAQGGRPRAKGSAPTGKSAKKPIVGRLLKGLGKGLDPKNR